MNDSRFFDRCPRHVPVIAVLCLLPLSPGFAQLLCPPAAESEPLPSHDEPPSLLADQLISNDDELLQVEGNVSLAEPGRRIRAERVVIDKRNETVRAEGAVTFESDEYVVNADSVTADRGSDIAAFEGARFEQTDSRFRGTAASIERHDANRSTLRDAVITACPPQAEDWYISADTIELNHESKQGTARGATLRFKDVPLFYLPWFRFPTGDERQSGFLAPSISYSDTSGSELQVPWYWNIAPQADATFAARMLSERGTQMQSQARLLTHSGSWQLDAEYLDDRDFGAERDFGHLQHSGELGERWSTSINASAVSDSDYFDDLGNSLSLSSLTHLQRRGDLVYHGDSYRLTGSLLSYQTIDDSLAATSRPYRKVPQLLLHTTPGVSGDLTYGLRAEAVQFDRDESVTGVRTDLQPFVSLPSGGAAWYVTPALALRGTRYELDNTAGGTPSTIDRVLPTVSLDAGLFLERDTGEFLQTLEPRAFLLYTPFEEQDDIPDFDTGRYTFSFAQLFRTNRFSGADRVADAEQLSLALSTRLLEPRTGIERFSFSAGQIIYFRDREVTLPGEDIETRPTSDAIIEAAAQLDQRWSLSGAVQYNPQEDRNDKGVLQLQFQRDQRRFANLAWRYSRELREQLDLSLRWQLTPTWSVLGRWFHSIPDDRVLENLAGFEYESCCWLFSVLARDRFIDDEQDNTQSVYVVLALKELTSIGRETESVLEHGILGYRRPAGY